MKPHTQNNPLRGFFLVCGFIQMYIFKQMYLLIFQSSDGHVVQYEKCVLIESGIPSSNYVGWASCIRRRTQIL